MKTSKAHYRAVQKYVKNHYDRIDLLLPKGDKETIKQLAASRGISVNSYIKNVLKAEISRYKENAAPKSLKRCIPKKKHSIETGSSNQ